MDSSLRDFERRAQADGTYLKWPYWSRLVQLRSRAGIAQLADGLEAASYATAWANAWEGAGRPKSQADLGQLLDGAFEPRNPLLNPVIGDVLFDGDRSSYRLEPRVRIVMRWDRLDRENAKATIGHPPLSGYVRWVGARSHGTDFVRVAMTKDPVKLEEAAIVAQTRRRGDHYTVSLTSWRKVCRGGSILYMPKPWAEDQAKAARKKLKRDERRGGCFACPGFSLVTMLCPEHGQQGIGPGFPLLVFNPPPRRLRRN